MAYLTYKDLCAKIPDCMGQVTVQRPFLPLLGVGTLATAANTPDPEPTFAASHELCACEPESRL